MPPDFYQYGTEDPSKMSSTPAPKEEPHKEPVTYTYVPPQAAPKEPNPEPPKTPMTFTYLPPQTLQHPCAAPFMVAPLCSPMGMMMAPVTYMPAPCDVPRMPVYAEPGVLYYPTMTGPLAPPQPPTLEDGSTPWRGPTKKDVEEQNAKIAEKVGATKPAQLIPYEAADGQQWWVRELDGSFTLRTTNDIMENCQPGRWAYANAGYPYFVRAEAPAAN
ncbi:hypothetical protein DTO280E4_91 [Paecilomyces variotii]|nr:hypothetical protein DTO280E4_91 [Paecilomyces variotii]